ncbi:prepilin peptidase [Amycolatopsis sp. NPDC059021]|uniref:prepilin peptidase n=1 Tax=Amycolatopsis sp. NPDC059021 TaxID=3346704 RepID=UPI00366AD191
MSVLVVSPQERRPQQRGFVALTASAEHRPDAPPWPRTSVTALISRAARSARRDRMLGCTVLLAAGGLAVVAWRVGLDGALIPYGLLVVLGARLAVIDWHTRVLPREQIYTLFAGEIVAFSILTVLRDDGEPLLRAVMGAAALAGVFLLVALAQPGGVGAGDVRLAGVTGLVAGWCGWPALVTTPVVAVLTAALVACTPLRQQDEAGRVVVPFGPCLLLAVVLVTTGLVPTIGD